jgi:hypothetical protein
VIAHNHGKLTNDHDMQALRLVVWTIQIIIGLIGVWLAGKIAIEEAKQAGWKQAPKRLWHLFLSGRA